jgi:transposase
MALSDDLRERLVAAVEAGQSRRAAGERFGVSAASAVRWMQRYRDTGSFSAKPSGGDRRSERIEAHADFILAAIGEQPDITLGELRAKLTEERGETFGTTTIWRFFDRRKITFKKSPHTPPSRNGRTS